jgi:Zn-dependent alcohol dehydrogenase
MRIESLELEGRRDDEVLVGIVASGICHTDIDFYDEWDGADEPVALGHEGAGVGIILKIGVVLAWSYEGEDRKVSLSWKATARNEDVRIP